jgi:hypothetical protein
MPRRRKHGAGDPIQPMVKTDQPMIIANQEIGKFFSREGAAKLDIRTSSLG